MKKPKKQPDRRGHPDDPARQSGRRKFGRYSFEDELPVLCDGQYRRIYLMSYSRGGCLYVGSNARKVGDVIRVGSPAVEDEVQLEVLDLFAVNPNDDPVIRGNFIPELTEKEFAIMGDECLPYGRDHD